MAQLFDLPIGITVAEFRSIYPKSAESRELSGLFHDLIGFDQVKDFSGFDTIICIGPVMFEGKPSMVIARVHNDTIYQYDRVFTNYVLMINRNRQLITDKIKESHPDPTDDYWVKFVDRKYSSFAEFTELKNHLVAKYLLPDSSIGDTTLIWKKYGVSLLARNSYSTSIVSQYDIVKGYDSRHEWQFCALIPDTSLLNIPIGSTKNNLAHYLKPDNFATPDTVIMDSLIYYQSHKGWGVPGRLKFVFHNDVLFRYEWQAQTTGHETMSGIFLIVTDQLDLHLKKKGYVPSRKNDNNEKLYYGWIKDDNIFYAHYYHNLRRLIIGYAPRTYVEN